MKISVTLTGITLALCACLSAQAQTTTTLNPTADAHINSGMPTTNYGTVTSLIVRQTSSTTNSSHASYFQFSLAGLPAGTITTARLRLYGQFSSSTGVPVDIRPSTGNATWGETALNWNNAGTIAPINYSTTPIATTTVTGTVAKYYEWDVTSFIASRRTIGHATVSAYTSTITTSTSQATFNSKEGLNRPQLVVTVDGTTPPPSSSWPMFGGDYNNSRNSNDTVISAANVSTLRVMQRITGSGVASTPAVVDGVVYFSDFGGNLKAVNANTGAVIWSTRLQTGMLTPSPYVSADTVYIAGDNSVVYAVNRTTGVSRWSLKIESSPSSRISGSPVLVGNTLIIGTSSLQVSAPVPSSPFRGRVVGIDIVSRTVKWSTPVCTGACTGVPVWSTAAIDTSTGLAFIGTGQAYTAPAGPYSDSVVAINYTTGALVWAYQFTPNDVYTWPNIGQDKDYDVGAAPNLFLVNGVKMVGAGDKGGSYAVMRRDTGALQWRTSVGFGSRRGGILGSTAYANGSIYLVENTSISEASRNSPTSVPGTGTAFSLDAATGRVNWSRTLGGGSIGAGVSYANGLVYAMTWDGQLRVINASSGVILKTQAAGTAVGSYVNGGFPNGSASGPVVKGGKVYVGYGWTWGSSVAGGLAIYGL